MHCAGLKGVCSASHQELEPPQGCYMRCSNATSWNNTSWLSSFGLLSFWLMELEASSLQWRQRLSNFLTNCGKRQQEITTALVSKNKLQNKHRMALAASSKNAFALVPPLAASSVNQACPASLKGVVLTWRWVDVDPSENLTCLRCPPATVHTVQNAFRFFHVINFVVACMQRSFVPILDMLSIASVHDCQKCL